MSLRFEFRTGDLSASPWEVRAHNESVYIYPTATMKDMKMSLHPDKWTAQITSGSLEKGRTQRPPEGRRDFWRFTQTPIGPEGVQFAFAVAATRSSFFPRAPDRKASQIEVPDRWNLLHVGAVWITDPAVAMEGALGGPQQLENGKLVWVTNESQVCPSEDSTLDYRGSILEAWAPETHSVAAPGFFIRGVTVAKNVEEGEAWAPATIKTSGVVFQAIDVSDF